MHQFRTRAECTWKMGLVFTSKNRNVPALTVVQDASDAYTYVLWLCCSNQSIHCYLIQKQRVGFHTFPSAQLWGPAWQLSISHFVVLQYHMATTSCFQWCEYSCTFWTGQRYCNSLQHSQGTEAWCFDYWVGGYLKKSKSRITKYCFFFFSNCPKPTSIFSEKTNQCIENAWQDCFFFP